METEPKAKEEEKLSKEAEKKKRKEDEIKKKEEEKLRKEDEKKKRKEDEVQKKEDAKRKKEEEKSKKQAEKEKAEKEKESRKNVCRAGVCRCWYCCFFHCCLSPLLWLYGMLLFALSLYFSLKYTLELRKSQQQLEPHLLYWGTVTYASLLIMLVQLVYLLVLFESIDKCGRCVFAFIFVVTFLICLAVLLLSIYCHEFCPKGKPVRRPVLTDRRWRAQLRDEFFILLLAAAVTMGLMVLLLHIYLHNVLQFIEEVNLRDNKEAYCDCGKPEAGAATLPANSNQAKNIPPTLSKYSIERELNNNNNYKPFSEIPRRYRFQYQPLERPSPSSIASSRNYAYNHPSNFKESTNKNVTQKKKISNPSPPMPRFKQWKGYSV